MFLRSKIKITVCLSRFSHFHEYNLYLTPIWPFFDPKSTFDLPSTWPGRTLSDLWMTHLLPQTFEKPNFILRMDGCCNWMGNRWWNFEKSSFFWSIRKIFKMMLDSRTLIGSHCQCYHLIGLNISELASIKKSFKLVDMQIELQMELLNLTVSNII